MVLVAILFVVLCFVCVVSVKYGK